jgi:hypothetical protein
MLLGLVLTGLASAAQAQAHVGVRAGVSADPGQFVFGGHIETKPILTHVTFRPNIEVGVGDASTLAAFNIEFAYWIPLDKKPWRVYLGGGPALIIQSFHNDNAHDPGGSDVGGGLNFMVGIQHSKGLFGEVKVGLIDSPSVKVMVGYAFK